MSQRRLPLHDVHVNLGARFADFGGWNMPMVYESIQTEHRHVRENAGIFDVSHMGEIRVTGPDSAHLLNRLTTNDISLLDPGEAHYSTITDDDGIILDDTVVYCHGPTDFLFIPNAGHDEEMMDRFTTYRNDWGLDSTVTNMTEEYAMFAVQGPDAPRHVAAVTPASVIDLKRFETMEATINDVDCWVARTGYTGENGFELIVPRTNAQQVWEVFEDRCHPCGLGARDTLRLEMGYLLSGTDFHPETNPRNPYEAGIGFTVKLDTDFVGRDALEQVEIEGVDEKLVGLQLIDRGVPRSGYSITDPDGNKIGKVTSGTVSPTLGEPIALGYVSNDYSVPETSVRIIIRGNMKKAKTRTTPFIPNT